MANGPLWWGSIGRPSTLKPTERCCDVISVPAVVPSDATPRRGASNRVCCWLHGGAFALPAHVPTRTFAVEAVGMM